MPMLFSLHFCPDSSTVEETQQSPRGQEETAPPTGLKPAHPARSEPATLHPSADELFPPTPHAQGLIGEVCSASEGPVSGAALISDAGIQTETDLLHKVYSQLVILTDTA